MREPEQALLKGWLEGISKLLISKQFHIRKHIVHFGFPSQKDTKNCENYKHSFFNIHLVPTITLSIYKHIPVQWVNAVTSKYSKYSKAVWYKRRTAKRRCGPMYSIALLHLISMPCVGGGGGTGINQIDGTGRYLASRWSQAMRGEGGGRQTEQGMQHRPLPGPQAVYPLFCCLLHRAAVLLTRGYTVKKG